MMFGVAGGDDNRNKNEMKKKKSCKPIGRNLEILHLIDSTGCSKLKISKKLKTENCEKQTEIYLKIQKQ